MKTEGLEVPPTYVRHFRGKLEHACANARAEGRDSPIWGLSSFALAPTLGAGQEVL